MDWGQSLINQILICLDALAFIFYLNRFIGLVPFLAGGIFRSSPLEHLEDSVSYTRDRNSVAVIALPALALIFSRYGVYLPSFMEALSPGLDTLVILGVLVVFIALREILVHAAAPSRGDRENYLLSARTLYDYIIISAAILLSEVGICAVFGLKDLTVRNIVTWSGIVVYFLFLSRRTQILRNSCSLFTAFLYLCSLELIPVGALVASEILF